MIGPPLEPLSLPLHRVLLRVVYSLLVARIVASIMSAPEELHQWSSGAFILSLRQKAIKGGAFLLVRQAIGIVLSVVGVLLVTRIIGPRQYGIFGVGSGIITFLSTFGTWGVDVYLLRKPETPREEEFQQAFTLLLLIAAILGGGAFLSRHLIAALVKIPEESSLIAVLVPGIVLSLLAIPAIVKLDRELNFKQVAINELISQVAFYVIAVPLAFRGAGAWAPTVGFLTQQGSLFVVSCWTVKFRPVLRWENNLIKQMLGYGLSYSSSVWVYQLRGLVSPLIVGRFAGPEAVGYVSVGVRIATMLSFAKAATWRISIPALAKLSTDTVRLRNSIVEGMRFQALAVGFPLASFALLAPFLIPIGFGHQWTSATKVYPFIAMSYLTNAMFNLHSSVLYLLGRNMRVTWFHLFHVALFAGSAMLLVPRMGFVGYGWAEVVALPSYLALHLFLANEVSNLPYEAPAIWYVTCVAAIVAGAMGPPALFVGVPALFGPLLFRKERTTMAGYAHILFSRVNA